MAHGDRQKTIVLTTETVPLEVARRAEQDWAIHDLDTPGLAGIRLKSTHRAV
jgi:hypothetical protein